MYFRHKPKARKLLSDLFKVYERYVCVLRAMKLYTLKHARLLFSDFFSTLLTIFCTISERLHPFIFFFESEIFRNFRIDVALVALGTIHLRRRHVLGGEGSKIGQICRRIVVKNCRRRGLGIKNRENLPTS